MGRRADVPAVVTCLNVNGLAVARTLGRHAVPVIGIHTDDTEPGTRSRYLRELWKCEPQPGALIDTLLARGPDLVEPPVLLPITDDAVTAVALNLDELRRFYRVLMPAADDVLRLIDKKRFDTLAREWDLPVPDTFVVDAPGELAAVAEAIRFPCIMKPQEKSAAYAATGAAKAYVLDDADALRTTYDGFCAAAPRVVIQQYVPGGDDAVFFCLQTCGADHAPLASFTGRKIRQWRPYCGGTAACEPVDEPRLAALTAEFFARARMVGPCSMEFKRDPRDGTFYLIEPTVCRTDWQSALADANGVPIAWIAYRDALDLKPVPTKRPRLARRWVDLRADRLSAHHYRTRGELGWLAWRWSIRPPVRGAYFALDDPRPYLGILRDTVRRGVRKLGRMMGLTASNTSTA